MTLLTFGTYWPLILAAILIPGLWWVRRFTVADLSAGHLRLSTILRTAIIGLLVLAMMQPILRRQASAVSVIYLLDVSQSVSPTAIQGAMQWIRKTNDSGKPAASGFIAFAANAMGFEKLDDLTQVAVSRAGSTGGQNTIDQSQTDIANAMEHAIHHFSPNYLKRLVLISDGNDNTGDIAAVLPQLKQNHVKVFTVPMAARSEKDVWVENLMAPREVNADEQFPIEAHIYSQSDVSGKVEIRNGAKTLAARTVSLKKGLNRIAFETSIPSSTGTVMLEAAVQVAGDPLPDNNVFRQPVIVMGKPRILYVEGHSPSAHYFKDALTTEGFSVNVIEPSAIPETAEEFGLYDAVVFSDVEAKAVSESKMQAVSTYVRDLGGGFILTGGENVYGENGYSKTPLEDLLPVTFDVKKPKPSVSMIVVLDKSGSMAGDKINYAKEATKAPVALLKETDHFGVITFNFNFQWVLKPQLVSDRAAITKAIDDIGVGGETNLYPAMKEAFIEMQKQSDEIKHVIILSDGRTLTDDFATMTKQMADARITVSTVAVGQEADRELLAKIANWGKGKTYYAEDPAGVPQIFNQDMESSASEALQETSFKLNVVKNIEAFKGIDLQAAPRLLGFVQTKSKPTAEVAIEAHKDRPLLARWQFGLGKSVIFTSDVKDRWAVDWLKWKSYSKFWSQMVRETMRRQDDADFDLRVERSNGFAVVSVDAVGKDGRSRDQLHLQAHVVAPDQSVSVFDLPQVGPGAYEARVPLKQQGSYMFRASSNGSDGVSRMLAYSYPDEYHAYPTNIDKLRAISAETGGAFQPKGTEIFDTAGESTTIATALWPWLTAFALGLYLIDVLLRRFRLFESQPRVI